MQAVQPKLAGLQPDLLVDDVRRSVEYYTNVLGLKSEGLFEMNGEIVHAEVSGGSTRIMFGPAKLASGCVASKFEGRARGSGVVFYIGVTEGIDTYYEQVRAAGAKVVEEITDQFWGDRTFMVEDPDGYLLSFAQHVKDFPAEMMGQIKPE